jgi:hypothetical protein
MKNTKTTSFSKMFFLSSFIFLSVNISLAQTTDPQFMRVKKTKDNEKGKTDNSTLNTNKSGNTNTIVTTPTPPPIVQPNYEEMS